LKILQEADLIRLCQSGDPEAIELLVKKYSRMAVRTAYMVTGRRDMAEDIAQEAFIQCFQSIKQLKRAEFFKTWFYRVLVRTAWKMASGAGKFRQVSIDGEEGGRLVDGRLPEEAFEAREAAELVYQAVSQLSKPLREVVVLHYLNGFTVSEIARVLGCREGTVKSRLHNARKLLARRLEKNGRDFISGAYAQTGKECNLNAEPRTV
jgi:RNA polymerase sigma-70 factor (ECF subfamily)